MSARNARPIVGVQPAEARRRLRGSHPASLAIATPLVAVLMLLCGGALAPAQAQSAWVSEDIGLVGVRGSGSVDRGNFTVNGAGADIFGTDDAFHFVYKRLSGDGQITARVATLQNTHPGAKAGVMIRDGLTQRARHVTVDVTPGDGLEFLRRPSPDGNTSGSWVAGLTAPHWVRLVRVGGVISAYRSLNGVAWDLVGTEAVALTGTVYAGLAVTSHVAGVLAAATFDNVTVTDTTTSPLSLTLDGKSAVSASNALWYGGGQVIIKAPALINGKAVFTVTVSISNAPGLTLQGPQTVDRYGLVIPYETNRLTLSNIRLEVIQVTYADGTIVQGSEGIQSVTTFNLDNTAPLAWWVSSVGGGGQACLNFPPDPTWSITPGTQLTWQYQVADGGVGVNRLTYLNVVKRNVRETDDEIYFRWTELVDVAGVTGQSFNNAGSASGTLKFTTYGHGNQIALTAVDALGNEMDQEYLQRAIQICNGYFNDSYDAAGNLNYASPNNYHTTPEIDGLVVRPSATGFAATAQNVQPVAPPNAVICFYCGRGPATLTDVRFYRKLKSRGYYELVGRVLNPPSGDVSFSNPALRTPAGSDYEYAVTALNTRFQFGLLADTAGSGPAAVGTAEDFSASGGSGTPASRGWITELDGSLDSYQWLPQTADGASVVAVQHVRDPAGSDSRYYLPLGRAVTDADSFEFQGVFRVNGRTMEAAEWKVGRIGLLTIKNAIASENGVVDPINNNTNSLVFEVEAEANFPVGFFAMVNLDRKECLDVRDPACSRRQSTRLPLDPSVPPFGQSTPFAGFDKWMAVRCVYLAADRSFQCTGRNLQDGIALGTTQKITLLPDEHFSADAFGIQASGRGTAGPLPTLDWQIDRLDFQLLGNTAPPGVLPSTWLSQDVGNGGVPGGATFSNGTFTVRGAGRDVYSTEDAFHFVYQPLVGDATITARVAALQDTHPAAKAGVMIREGLTAAGRHALVDASPGNGFEFLRRVQPGESTLGTWVMGITAPHWVRLVRSGQILSGYRSVDGVNWTLVGSQSLTLTGNLYIGLAVTSRVDGVAATGAFDNVTVTAGAPAADPPQ